MKIIITEQQLNSKLTPIFDKYITRMYPELLSKNTNLKMSPDETTVYIINPQYKSFDLKPKLLRFFTFITKQMKNIYIWMINIFQPYQPFLVKTNGRNFS